MFCIKPAKEILSGKEASVDGLDSPNFALSHMASVILKFHELSNLFFRLVIF